MRTLAGTQLSVASLAQHAISVVGRTPDRAGVQEIAVHQVDHYCCMLYLYEYEYVPRMHCKVSQL